MGTMSEATYRSNARAMLEGDDCFRMEQLYSVCSVGSLVLAFLPEKEEKQGSSDDDGRDDDDCDESPGAAKGEWSSYTESVSHASNIRSVPEASPM